MTQTDTASVPSLLDKEMTGGVTAERGFGFQDGVFLTSLPQWLAEEGFTSCIRESYGDIEAMFFLPGIGYVKEFLEVKDYSITPATFRKEFEDFRRMETASPQTYRWFTFVCTHLSNDLQPLVNGLRNLRDPYQFYDSDPVLQEASYADCERRVLNLGQEWSKDDARFLFEKVRICAEYGTAAPGEGLFSQRLRAYQPHYDLSQSTLTNVYAALSKLLKERLRVPVTRKEIETAIRAAIPQNTRPAIPPAILRTHPDAEMSAPGLRFPWEQFFAGDTRAYPPPEDWTAGVVSVLRETRQWIDENRLSRRVRLEGSRRLSAAFAFGAVFSAVAGYGVEMNHRDQTWATDAHPQADTPPYTLQHSTEEGDTDDLVVTIGILRDIVREVETGLPMLGLHQARCLHLSGQSPLLSAEQANLLAGNIKQAVSRAVAESGARRIHLFYAGPSHLALFLGHRWNATVSVQCYEWVAANTYVPTCLLNG